MTEATAKHREEAREAVRTWLLTSNPHHLIQYKDELINRIASALSSRDKEIREVLEGLRYRHGCWCELPPNAGSPDHTHACDATRALYAKVQPAKESSDD